MLVTSYAIYHLLLELNRNRVMTEVTAAAQLKHSVGIKKESSKIYILIEYLVNHFFLKIYKLSCCLACTHLNDY